MPGFNGMGPNNDGPNTGRGLGICGDAADENKALWGRGQGGAGSGCGRGRGMGKRKWRGSSGNFFPSVNTKFNDDCTSESLKSQKEFLTARLKVVEEQLMKCSDNK